MIHHIFANRSNIGDWLSALGIQSLIAPIEVTEHLCDEPFVEETMDRLSMVGDGDFIVIGGGGLFMDYFEPFWRGFRDISDRVPFCVWGAGFCDLKREASRPPMALIEEILAKSQLNVVRDQLTHNLLSRLSLPPPVPCPSLCVVKRPGAPGHGLLHVDNYTTAGSDIFDAMEAYGREFAQATGRPFRRTNNRIKAGDRGELKDTLARYAVSDIVISSGLHGCVIALAMGRKVIAVSGDYKLESFMQAAGLQESVCDIAEVDEMPSLLCSLQEQRSAEAFFSWARGEQYKVAKKVLDFAGGRALL